MAKKVDKIYAEPDNPMTWELLKAWIRAGRLSYQVVWCREGTFCGRCAAPMPAFHSACAACRADAWGTTIKIPIYED